MISEIKSMNKKIRKRKEIQGARKVHRQEDNST
jgi:hypothetical protein